LLPPPAVSTSALPSRSHGFLSSIVVKLPSWRPSPSSSRHGRAIPRRRVAPSITLNLSSRRPSPPIAVVLSVHCRRACAIPRRQGAIAPSIAAHRRCALGPLPPCLHHPLPTRSHCAVHCRQGPVALSIAVAVEDPSCRPLPSRSHRGAVAPSLAV